MSVSMEKKHGNYFTNITAAISRTISGWREIYHLKAEIKHCRSTIELLEFSIEFYKEGVGASAYDLWTKGSLNEDSLNEDFQEIKEQEEDIVRQNARIASLEEQIEMLRENREVKIQKAERQKPEQQKPENQKPENQAPQIVVEATPLPVVCPACGARYKLPVNFCRRCGAGLLQESTGEEKNDFRNGTPCSSKTEGERL